MNVLIVESAASLASIWRQHLERLGCRVHVAMTSDEAFELIQQFRFRVIVLDLVLDKGSALAVSDLAAYRQPDARVIFVTNTNFFSDGSIFGLCRNACAFLPSATAPRDLACMVEHHARQGEDEADRAVLRA